MVRILRGVEQDSHRQPLYYFDVITGGVFRGQQAETVAAGTWQVFHVTAIIPAEGIDVNRDLLARCMRASCVSLKFAVTQMSSVSVANIRVCPGWIREPSCTERLSTMPFAGA